MIQSSRSLSFILLSLAESVWKSLVIDILLNVQHVCTECEREHHFVLEQKESAFVTKQYDKSTQLLSSSCLWSNFLVMADRACTEVQGELDPVRVCVVFLIRPRRGQSLLVSGSIATLITHGWLFLSVTHELDLRHDNLPVSQPCLRLYCFIVEQNPRLLFGGSC